MKEFTKRITAFLCIASVMLLIGCTHTNNECGTDPSEIETTNGECGTDPSEIETIIYDELYSTHKTDVIFGFNKREASIQYMIRPAMLFFDNSLPSETEIEFEGQTYLCKYTISYCPNDWQTEYNTYYSTSEKAERSFFIDRNTGEIVGWFYWDLLKQSGEEPENAEAYVIEQAERIARQYLDIDQFRMKVIKNQMIMTDYGYYDDHKYVVKYVRYVGDYATSEQLVVLFESDGSLSGVMMQNLGCFNGFTEKDIPEIDQERLQRSLDQYMTTEYPKLEYRIGDRFLAISKKGQLMLVTCYDECFYRTWFPNIIGAATIIKNL